MAPSQSTGDCFRRSMKFCAISLRIQEAAISVHPCREIERFGALRLQPTVVRAEAEILRPSNLETGNSSFCYNPSSCIQVTILSKVWSPRFETSRDSFGGTAVRMSGGVGLRR